MKSPLIARFTPSLMAPADLEAIFVQRENLAQRLVEQIRESVLTPAKHHNLLIGPRGIGKSHLTTLVVNRVVAQADIRERMIVAWLREEEWGVMSFLDLLLRILRAVSEESGVSIPQERLDAIHDAPPSQAEKLAVRLARDVIADKTLFIIIENLDEIFNGLALREQRAFRAFLQEKNCHQSGSARPCTISPHARGPRPRTRHRPPCPRQPTGVYHSVRVSHRAVARRPCRPRVADARRPDPVLPIAHFVALDATAQNHRIPRRPSQPGCGKGNCATLFHDAANRFWPTQEAIRMGLRRFREARTRKLL